MLATSVSRIVSKVSALEADLAAARRRIEELEGQVHQLALDLAVLDAPDRADNIATRNGALAEAETARQRIKELEAEQRELRSAAQVVLNFASRGSDVVTVHLGRLDEAIRLGGEDE